ncbi:MAG: zinc-ribbon domain-containing protein, partial [Acidaminococcaceae bacterium]|nr:zinc-ribbon domain-containing protein [Acidaminococcaceae bacterium]
MREFSGGGPMKFCETCKNEYDDNTVFCTQCGARLTEKSAETSMLNNTD